MFLPWAKRSPEMLWYQHTRVIYIAQKSKERNITQSDCAASRMLAIICSKQEHLTTKCLWATIHDARATGAQLGVMERGWDLYDRYRTKEPVIVRQILFKSKIELLSNVPSSKSVKLAKRLVGAIRVNDMGPSVFGSKHPLSAWHTYCKYGISDFQIFRYWTLISEPQPN